MANLEEIIEFETWKILQQLKRDFILTPKNQYVLYEVSDHKEIDGYPSIDTQIKIIEKLQSDGVLKIYKERYFGPRNGFLDNLSLTVQLNGAKPRGFLLEINRTEFEILFSKYEHKFSAFNNASEKKYNEKLYITKNEDGFNYKGRRLKLSNANYQKVFDTLYTLLPAGGFVEYKDITDSLKTKYPKFKNKKDEEIRKIILTGLTDSTNGFFHYAEIPNQTDDGKKLIEVDKGKGLYFNNKI